ncbi:MAG TPA: amidohydrolase family protein [Bryobacteraceae bacterium]|nr:amidohydrolase family protein [Bryobacteraceae bacterium]
MRRLIFFLAVICADAQVTAFVNVTVIDPGTSAIRSSLTVIVDGARIQAVQPASATIPKAAKRVDGRGKFLIPGLQDSHVHLTKAGLDSLRLFIANGVTSVRDLGSDLAEVSNWRNQIESGKIIGPRITTSGQILESADNVARMKKDATVEPVDRIRLPLSNPDDAIRAVQRLKAGGADHVKMRTTPDTATFQAAVAEARRLNLPFTMHAITTLDEMAAAGVRSVEHFGSYPPLDALSDEVRRALFERVAKSGMFLSTTLTNVDESIRIPYAKAKQRVEDGAGLVDPLRKYVCGYLVEDWREQVEERKDGAYDGFIKTLPGLYRDVREMHRAGVRVIAGTDAAVVFMYPGFSMHDEFAKLVEHAAFTPMEALRSATYNAAMFHGSEGSRGSIAAGQAADLVLLDANPIANIRNTRRIQGVMARGKWLDRGALDDLLNQAQRACSTSR